MDSTDESQVILRACGCGIDHAFRNRSHQCVAFRDPLALRFGHYTCLQLLDTETGGSTLSQYCCVMLPWSLAPHKHKAAIFKRKSFVDVSKHLSPVVLEFDCLLTSLHLLCSDVLFSFSDLTCG